MGEDKLLSALTIETVVEATEETSRVYQGCFFALV